MQGNIPVSEGYEHIQSIKGIPTAITDNDNENFYHWWASGIRNANLLNFDKHKDMLSKVRILQKLETDSYKYFDIRNYNCAAVHHNFFKSIYHCNPYLQKKKKRLTDFGSTNPTDERPKLKTKIDTLTYWDESGPYEIEYILWDTDDVKKSILHEGKIIPLDSMVLEEPMIVKVDLDSICLKHIYYYKQTKIKGWEKRMDFIVQLLKEQRRPTFITITRSVGDVDERKCYVPKDKVNKVLNILIERLKEIY